MRQEKLGKYLEEARKNKQQRLNTDEFKMPQENEVYPALILDAWFDSEKQEIKIEFIIFASLVGTRWEVQFRTNSKAINYYREICKTIGSNNNPRNLIGKSVFLHLERNGGFLNVRVDESISEEELQDILAEMEDEEKNKKERKNIKKMKVKAKKSKTKTHSKVELDDLELDDDLSDFN